MTILVENLGHTARLILALAGFAISGASFADVYRLADITKNDFESLDRDRSAVFIPLGVIEEHGPYLPLLTDSYWAERIVDEVAEEISAQRDWSNLILPSLPIGVGAPEDFGPRVRSFGSIPLRPSTKRAILMDLVTGLGDAGFRWIFVVDIHGPAINKRVTDEASQYFEDVFGGTMVNLTGVVDPDAPATQQPLTEDEQREDGLAVHAGLTETSVVKYLRPDLVRPDHADAPSVTPTSWEDYESIPNEPDWPGYFGSPRLARADIGADLLRVQAANAAALALRIIDGFDHHKLERLADSENPALRRLDQLISNRSAEIRKRQKTWMQENGIEE